MTNEILSQITKFWNDRPCQLRHSNAPVGTRQYFEEVEQRRYMIEPHIATFADFGRWKGKRVLEIGCGQGTDGLNFVRAGADYTGIELSEVSLNLAKKRFEIFGAQGRLILGDAEELWKLIGAEERFDLIYSMGVIHHSISPEEIVRWIPRYMHKHGSEFRLMLYAKNSWKKAMIDAGLDQFEAQAGCPVAHTYTEDDVHKLLKDFTFRNIEQTFIFPWNVEKYVNYEYELQPWFAAMPKPMFRALEKAFGWHLLITAKLA